ncbi:MAG: chemotaxis protein CheW [Candidatus Wallbacteria bacterium]
MAEAKQFCTFYLDKIFFGISVTNVLEIIKFLEMTPVPLSDELIRGLINLRGQIVTAINLKKMLEINEIENGPEINNMNIIIKTEHGPVSLIADEIGDVLELEDDIFEKPPETIPQKIKELITGTYKLKEKLLLVLSAEKIMSKI